MDIRKLFLAAFLVTLFNILVGMLTCGSTFSWVYQIPPTEVWKDMNNGIPAYYYITLFIENIIFVVVYAYINKSLAFDKKFVKGAIYGLIVFGVGLLPGMLSTYTFMNVATEVVIYWLIWSLVVIPIKGALAAIVYGE